MKRVVSLILAIVMLLALCACKSKEAANVETLTDAIGEVTLDSESAIIAAENAYNALSDEDKSEVENYEILTAARAALDDLLYDAEMNEKYDNALALLDSGNYKDAYNAFVALGNWKDSEDYVGRFTILEDVVLEETQILHGNLEDVTSVIQYEYDSQGRVIQKVGDYLDYHSCSFYAYTDGNLWTYEYDDNDNLVCVKHYKEDEISLKIDFTYDDNYSLTGGFMITNLYKINLFFENNEDGDISRIIFVGDDYAGLTDATYGALMDCTYEDGLLTHREDREWGGESYYNMAGSTVVSHREYQYDEKGLLESLAVSNSGYTLIGDVEASFTYGTYYGFDLP